MRSCRVGSSPSPPHPPTPTSLHQPHQPLPDLSAARRTLKDVFGFEAFRPQQEEIIANLLQRRDTVAVLATGAGKSLCYQLPALLFDGLTVVVSPLISLMQDQVDALRQLAVPAVYLNSTLDYGSYLATVERINAGAVKLLYVAPETLLRPEILVMLDHCGVTCLTIDEAHCISQWGHDFRTEYRQLHTVRQRYPQAVCLALTATAAPRVQRDIAQTLGLRDADTFVASFDRANLYLAAQPRTAGLRQLQIFLAAHKDHSGIIYCATRKHVDTLVAQLETLGYKALPYHAGLDDATRARNQRAFVRDDVPIMVATVAFGMGIHKSNVRFIVHYTLPPSIEHYYQEIGRAGRDGLPADCLLLYSTHDVQVQLALLEEGAESERPGRQARLQAMMRYAQGGECRRKPLLAYFGEIYRPETCGQCDACRYGSEDRLKTDVTDDARAFLQCVLQTGEHFGIAHVVLVLRGSQAQRVRQFRHERLSTYGAGKHFPEKQWKALAQQFIQQGLVAQDMEHGTLGVTAKGKAVLAQGEKVLVFLELGDQASADGKPAYDEALFELLRRLRRQLADAANVPPYVIFSDRSLADMATFRPHSAQSFLAIDGVGQVKLERYGEPFLAVIGAYCAEHGLVERPIVASDPVLAASGGSGKRRFVEVGDLFAAGASIVALQEMYGVKQSTILNHLYDYVRAGGRVDAERVLAVSRLPIELQNQVMRIFAEIGAERLTPVFEQFAGAIAYDDLHLLRLVYRARQVA